MRELAQKLAQLTTGTQIGQTFRVSPGVFFLPNGVCPWCRASMRSPLVWHLGTSTLKGRWKIAGRRNHLKLKRETRIVEGRLTTAPSHPHASGTYVCMGDGVAAASNTATALFFAMNPAGAMSGWRKRGHHWKNWLKRVWDHDCPKLPERRRRATASPQTD